MISRDPPYNACWMDWSMWGGPVQYLYIPAPLLKKGRNEIIIFKTEGRIADTLTLEEQPVYVDVG